MVATCALGSQKSVGQYPAAQILLKLFDHEIWQWVPQVLFDLMLECQPVGLNQFIERSFFRFVALVVIGLCIGYRHRRRSYLQLSWPFRIALLMAMVILWSGNTTTAVWLWSVQSGRWTEIHWKALPRSPL